MFCVEKNLFLKPVINLSGIRCITSSSLSGSMTYVYDTVTHTLVYTFYLALLSEVVPFFFKKVAFSADVSVSHPLVIQTKSLILLSCLPQVWICSGEFKMLCSCSRKPHNFFFFLGTNGNLQIQTYVVCFLDNYHRSIFSSWLGKRSSRIYVLQIVVPSER